MLNILISLLTFVLIILSLFMVLVVLMQRANTNAGMGSAFGGGVAESAFGTETTNVLVKATKWSAAAFFVIALVLYLLFMSRTHNGGAAPDADLPDIPVAAQTEPAVTGEPLVTEAQQAVDAAASEEAPPAPAAEVPAAGQPVPGN